MCGPSFSSTFFRNSERPLFSIRISYCSLIIFRERESKNISNIKNSDKLLPVKIKIFGLFLHFFSLGHHFFWCLYFISVVPLSKNALLSCLWVSSFRFSGLTDSCHTPGFFHCVCTELSSCLFFSCIFFGLVFRMGSPSTLV